MRRELPSPWYKTTYSVTQITIRANCKPLSDRNALREFAPTQRTNSLPNIAFVLLSKGIFKTNSRSTILSSPIEFAYYDHRKVGSPQAQHRRRCHIIIIISDSKQKEQTRLADIYRTSSVSSLFECLCVKSISNRYVKFGTHFFEILHLLLLGRGSEMTFRPSIYQSPTPNQSSKILQSARRAHEDASSIISCLRI